jgi:hypothetical protein
MVGLFLLIFQIRREKEHIIIYAERGLSLPCASSAAVSGQSHVLRFTPGGGWLFPEPEKNLLR